MVLLVETTRPTVGMTVGHVTLRTIIVMVVGCLGGVVHVYSPVSPSVAWNILSLYSRVEAEYIPSYRGRHRRIHMYYTSQAPHYHHNNCSQCYMSYSHPHCGSGSFYQQDH